MAVFKKFENQEVRLLDAVVTNLSANLYVGDLISFDPGTNVVAPIVATDADNTTNPATPARSIEENAEIAMAAGKEVYIVAQGDMITYNEPTAYKTYKIEDVVDKAKYKDATTGKKLIAGFLVKTLTNLEV